METVGIYTNWFICTRSYISFYLVASKYLEYNFWQNYFWESHLMDFWVSNLIVSSTLMGDLFLSKPGKRYGLHFLLHSEPQMRGITSPTSRPHRRCRQSQQIESLAFTNLSWCNEHYRRRHWFIATSYDLPSSHRQRCLLPPPPSEDNDDNDDNNKDHDHHDDTDNDDDGTTTTMTTTTTTKTRRTQTTKRRKTQMTRTLTMTTRTLTTTRTTMTMTTT